MALKGEEYAAWIEAFHVRVNARGQCAEATQEMGAAFPELRRVRGHVMTRAGYERAHWWLETVGGEVVDPTELQFDEYGGVLAYLPWDESQPEPTGKCLNCGGLCFDDSSVCGDACAVAYTAYLMNP